MNASKKRIAVLQSNYIPWKGYFDIIGMVDEFVVYDQVQFTKNDWRNRNRIKTSQGVKWLTIPVFQKNLSQRISETKVSQPKWSVKHWNSIVGSYSRAPYFKEMSERLELFFKTTSETYLSVINSQLIQIICELLEIKTKILNSADYTLRGNPTERLVDLCKQTGATYYLSGPAAKDYLQDDLFKQEGIEIEWMDYGNYPVYPQLFPPFTHEVSIIDLLFNAGKNSRNYMKLNVP